MRLRTAGDVGAYVRDTRRRMGLTQGELAARSGLTRRWVSAVESGSKASMDLRSVLAALEALGVELDARWSDHTATPVEPPASADALDRVDLDELLRRHVTPTPGGDRL